MENSTQSGLPKLTIVQSDRLLNRLVLKDHRQNLSYLISEFNSFKLASKPLSKRSVQRKLNFLQYSRWKVAKTPTNSKTNRKSRLEWCKLCKTCTVNQNCKSVIFSDEKLFWAQMTAYMCGGKWMKRGDWSVWGCVPYEMGDLGSRFHSGVVFVIRESGHLNQLMVI